MSTQLTGCLCLAVVLSIWSQSDEYTAYWVSLLGFGTVHLESVR